MVKINKVFGKKLSSRLILILSLSMLTVYLVVGVVLSRYMLDRQMAYLQSAADLKARTISKDISSSFVTTKVIVQQMTYNQEFIKYLREVNTRDMITRHPLYADVHETLKKIAKSNTLFYIAWVANDQASFYIDNTGYISDANYVITGRPWHKVASEAQGVTITKPYVDYGTGKTILSCITPIIEGGKNLGFCAIDLEIGVIPEYMKRFKIGTTGYNFLLSGDGTFIYNEDAAKIMSKTIYQEKTGLENYAKEIMNQSQGFKEIVFEGKAYFLSYQKIDESGWIVGSLINKFDALKDYNLLSLRIYVFLIFSTVLMLLVIYLIISKMTEPFSVVTDHAQIIAEGDFSRNLPEKYIMRDDEMGELSKAVQMITHAFRRENEILEAKIKEKNLELQEQYRYISEAERIASLGILVAGIAHEINTPLGVSMTSASYLERIERESKVNVENGKMTKGQYLEFMQNADDCIEIIISNLNRTADLVSTFKQVAVSQNIEKIVPFSLHEYIQLVGVSVSTEHSSLDLDIENNCPKDLVIESYPGIFSQIFTNLILNSIKHGFENRTHGTIYIDCRLEKDMLNISYSDDGRGIQQEDLSRVFDPFFTTNRQLGNSGLGMYIVYNLITQKLKGTIHLDSEWGEGVHIAMEIPLEN